MNAALIWIALPLVISLLIILIRANYRLSCWLQIATSFSLAFIAILSFVNPAEKTGIRIIEIAPIFNILGRSLIIDENLKYFITILYSFLCMWTIALYIFNVKSRIVPLGLAFMAFVITSLAVEPFLYSALLIELAVIVSSIMVVDSNSPSKTGILRYMTLGLFF